MTDLLTTIAAHGQAAADLLFSAEKITSYAVETTQTSVTLIFTFVDADTREATDLTGIYVQDKMHIDWDGAVVTVTYLTEE